MNFPVVVPTEMGLKFTSLMRSISVVLSLLIWNFVQVQAQDQKGKSQVEGRVVERLSSGVEEALVGVNVYWVGGNDIVSTDINGEFKIDKTASSDQLIFSYVSYENDTITVNQDGFILVALENEVQLGTVEVKSRKKTSSISFVNPIKTLNIGEKELAKAACCNLSESFETSPSVDVSFTDAVTGTRQIQLLGLAGPYTQITRENIPDIRGLSALNGLGHSPGTWVESIQLNKGTGSVINGYESIAGQINVELQQPDDTEKFYVNLYGNIMGRGEANVHFSQKLSEKLYTGILTHYSQNTRKNDQNKDGFLDNPLKQDIILLNRWKFIGDNGVRAQLGVKYVNSTHFGGQLLYDGLDADKKPNIWGLDLNNQRIEAWSKTGWVNEKKPTQSFGLQLSAMSHSQESLFGDKKYDAKQNLFYANFIYQGDLWNCNHKFKTGASFQFDQFDEEVSFFSQNFTRNEIVPGIYGEYAYKHLDKFGIVLGLRGDYHNNYGFFVTPRLHLRYAVNDGTVVRLSAGKGQRTASIFAENFALLASNRTWNIQQENDDTPYGLDQEVAWNYGLSLTQDFKIDYREGAISIDFFRTDFQNQIIVDVDGSPKQVSIYNLDGASFSNSFQAQVDYELVKRLDLRIAYRWFDVQTQYRSGLLDKALISKHRAFVNLAYETRDAWAFDYTLNWQGPKRIPFTGSNPAEFQLSTSSPSFVLMNAQVSKSWKEKFDVYVGVENILGFRQKDAILDAENPFSENFDASLVWGPVFGRNIYAGLRYRIF